MAMNNLVVSIETTNNHVGSSTTDVPSIEIVPSIPAGDILEIERKKTKLNRELSILYCATDDIWDRTSTAVDESFVYMIAEAFSCEEEDPEPRTIEEAMCRPDWLKWKTAIEEYASLRKRKVFGPIVNTLPSRPVEYKMV